MEIDITVLRIKMEDAPTFTTAVTPKHIIADLDIHMSFPICTEWTPAMQLSPGIIMQKSICADLFAHKRVRNLGQAERFRVRDVHTPLVSKEDWREVKSRVSMPDREAVILEDITGKGVLAELHPIQFKEDIDV